VSVKVLFSVSDLDLVCASQRNPSLDFENQRLGIDCTSEAEGGEGGREE
jgi:hypothetical protein